MVQAKPRYVRNVAGKLSKALGGVASKKREMENSQLRIDIELENELSEPYCQ